MRGSPGGVHGRSSHCAWAEWQNHCRDVCCWGVRLRVQGWLACISLLPAPPCLGLPPLASGPPWGIRAGQGITDACLWGMANIPMSLMALLWQDPEQAPGRGNTPERAMPQPDMAAATQKIKKSTNAGSVYMAPISCCVSSCASLGASPCVTPCGVALQRRSRQRRPRQEVCTCCCVGSMRMCTCMHILHRHMCTCARACACDPQALHVPQALHFLQVHPHCGKLWLRYQSTMLQLDLQRTLRQ